MNFQTKRINDRPKKKTDTTSQPNHVAILIGGIVALLLLFFLGSAIVKSLDLTALVFSFGQKLEANKNETTNILLVGVGGEGHDGSDLTDTIMLANIDAKNKKVKMLSLPRDLFIDDKNNPGRINKIYAVYKDKYSSSPAAMEELKKVVTKLTNEEIQYYVKVDFNGFVDLVDSLGGVAVDVKNTIHDTTYPKGETIYTETFHIDAGLQTLDGKTALKYARSRHTTSDYDRARRQQQLLSAIKEKAMSLQILTDPGKIQDMYKALADNFETDLSIQEILELAKIGKDINQSDIQSRVLTEDFTDCGGLLYSPPRDVYGAAVVLPAGKEYEMIQQFSNNYFNENIDPSDEIQVLNGTKTSGVASLFMNRLSRQCLNVVYYGNAANRDLEKSTIYYKPTSDGKEPSSIKIIKQWLNAPVKAGIPEEYVAEGKRINTNIVIELGKDYKEIHTEDPVENIELTPVAAPTVKTTEPTASTTKAETTAAEVPQNTPSTTDAN